MSDLLTSGLLADGESYLVAYPLKESTSYVLARTWPATEMPRPGSVWTHSLVLDYSTLAVLDDPGRLIALLRRPTTATLQGFADPIVVPAGSPSESGCDPRAHASAKSALLDLYAPEPSRQVEIVGVSPELDEALALALWRQMWPGLRRDTALFTRSDMRLDDVDASCVIAFSSRAAPVAIEANDVFGGRVSEVVDVLAEDLPILEQTELRAFVGRHAFDAARPRAAVFPLVRLWSRLAGSDPAADVVGPLVEVGRHIGAQRLARDVVDRLLTTRTTFDGLVSLVRQFGPVELGERTHYQEVVEIAEGAGDASVLLVESARHEEPTFGGQTFKALARGLTLERLLAVSCAPKVKIRLALLRPELFGEKDFWPLADTDRAAMVTAASQVGVDFDKVSRGIGRAVGRLALESAVAGWPDQGARWAFALVDAAPLGEGVLSQLIGRAPALVRLAVDQGARLQPGAAECVMSAAFAAGQVSLQPERFWIAMFPRDADLARLPSLACVTLADVLATGGSDAWALRTFGIVYDAARRGTLPRDAERYIDAVARASGVHRWSFGASLVDAAVKAFSSSSGPRPELLAMVSDEEQLEALLSAIYSRDGAAGVRDLLRRAAKRDELVEPWKIDKARRRLQRAEKRSWFW